MNTMNQRKNVTTQVLLSVGIGTKRVNYFKSFRGELSFSLGDALIPCSDPDNPLLDLEAEITSTAKWYLDERNAQMKCYEAVLKVSTSPVSMRNETSMKNALLHAGWRVDGML